MITQRPGKTFLKIYFILSLVLGFVCVFDNDKGFTCKDIVNFSLSFLSLLSLYGYISERRFFSQRFWKIFAVIYLVWEAGCYTVLYSNSIVVNLVIFLISLPNYWCVILYPFETLEEDSDRKKVILERELTLRKFLLSFVS